MAACGRWTLLFALAAALAAPAQGLDAACQGEATCQDSAVHGESLLQREAGRQERAALVAEAEGEEDEEEDDAIDEHSSGRGRAALLEHGVTGLTMRGASDEERDEFLRMHNMYRCMHNSPAVVWSDYMAADAALYVKNMTEMEHSDSYGLEPPVGPAGENLAWSSGALTAGDAVDAWYHEVNDCDTGGPESFTDGCAEGVIDPAKGTEKATGHFTAMIWAGVKEIGCAFSDSAAPTVIICRYRAGDQLSADTPNMEGHYVAQVGVRTKTADECSDISGGDGGVIPPTGSPAPEPAPVPTPAPPSGFLGIRARYVRIYPMAWQGSVTTRAAVLVGEDLAIVNPPELKRTYSSVLSTSRSPGRPGSSKGCSRIRQVIRRGWTAARSQLGEWMEMDLGSDKDVRGVILQGKPKSGCPAYAPHAVFAIKVATAPSENATGLVYTDGGRMYNTRKAVNRAEVQVVFGEPLSTTTTTTVNCAAADESMTGNGEGYRGCQTQTMSGLTCQDWESQSPHKHTITPFFFPDSGLGSNYCRNPDGEDTIWCYTTSSKRWEHCLPVGQTTTTTTIDCGPAAETVTGDGSDYRGCQTQTESGRTCQAWAATSPHANSFNNANYPKAGLGANYCRNPDGEPRIWCYTTDPRKRWEYCNPVGHTTTTATTTSFDCASADESGDGSGSSYRGCQTVTRSGATCQAWDSQSPHRHSRTPTNYPGAGLVSNYCRNPDGEPFIWCYTTGRRRWEYCRPLGYSPPPPPTVDCAAAVEKVSGRGRDYRGCQDKTRSGRTCQRWDEQTPHRHSRNDGRYPGTGLVNNNYCRNPDNSRTIWCYTTSSNKRWEYCDPL